MAKIHPAEPSTAFWAWSRCLAELIAWATDPDAETTSSEGWREQFRNDIRDRGDRARDASADDVTRNQVTRSRSLASQLVRMLNETSELNATPCRNWLQVDRLVVEQLAELQAAFAKLSDGTNQVVATLRRHDIPPSESKATRSNLDWLKLVPPPNAETWHRQELIGNTTAEIMEWCDMTKRQTLRSRNGKSLWLMRTADNKIACYFRSETEYAKANLRKLQPPKKSEETKTNQKRPKRRESAKRSTTTP